MPEAVTWPKYRGAKVDLGDVIGDVDGVELTSGGVDEGCFGAESSGSPKGAINDFQGHETETLGWSKE
jgi:hypothetical protein